MDEERNCRWLTDANSLEFLDLCTRKFQEKPSITAVYALDLCATPRRYNYSSWPDVQRARSNGQLPSLEIDHFALNRDISNKKLIELFGLGAHPEDARIESDVASSSIFSDFTRRVLKRVSTNYEPETLRLYIKHMTAYFHYFNESIFRGVFDNDSNIITYEKPPTIECSWGWLYVKIIIIEQAASKLLKLLFENLCSDSSLVAELVHKMFIHYPIKGTLFFTYEAKMMEYLFYHLRKANCSYFGDVAKVFEESQDNITNDALIRSNPEHLLVLLNSGIKFIRRPVSLDSQMECIYEQLHPVEEEAFEFWYTDIYLRLVLSDLKPREVAIIEFFAFFFAYRVPYYNIYLDCQRYIWRSIPDAFITYQEMRNLLVRILNTTVVEDICNQLQDRDFDCFDIVPQPRSLQHYSRCAIRDTLMCNSQLPDGISFLGLPKRFQSYLRLEL